MIASAWESLTQLMVKVTLWVDYLQPVMFWGILLTALILVCIWLVKLFNHVGGHGPGLTINESCQSSLLDRLDERACVVISRRPRRRKRRHHRSPSAHRLAANSKLRDPV